MDPLAAQGAGSVAILETRLFILFLIRCLNVGGAERQLIVLAKELARRGNRVAIASFYNGGALESELAGSCVELYTIGKAGRWDILPFLGRLITLLRSERPDVLYSFMPAENLTSTLVKPFTPDIRRVWGIQTAYLDLSEYDYVVRLVYRLEALLSRSADLIISNSQAGVEHAAAKGFPSDRMEVVGNGVDTVRFRPDPAARSRVRSEFGLTDGHIVFGTLSRLDPLKDFPTFLSAASLVAGKRANARFLCVGGGPLASKLRDLTEENGLQDRVVWAGSRSDPEACLNAMDVFCSSSITEGLSNSIAEAMACGLPSAVTDVGDSAALVGDSGIVVPAQQPEALANALLEASDGAAACGHRARARILEGFSVEALGRRTEAALRRASSKSLVN